MPTTISDSESSTDERAVLPSCRLGFINPLDVIDTFAFEFYRLAPSNSIATMVSIGLAGFSGSAAASAVDANLTRCLKQLAKREVELMVLGGLPLLFNLGQGYSKEFAARCEEEFGIKGVTSVDASLAAFRSLKVSNPVVINKWDATLNDLVASTLEAEGIHVAGAVTEVHTVGEIKAKFEAGVDVALRLTEKALTQHPSADCLFIAGGAWLVAPFISQIEREFGVPVVAGQASKIWYSLNVADNHVDRPEFGRLMATRMTGAAA